MNNFYDELAESYHLIFDDWDAAIVRQRDVLARLLPNPANGKRILDCACGIGTQSIGMAMLGFSVEGSDLSGAAISRARRETKARGLKIEFRVDDMRRLSTAPIDCYDAILAMDNAVPHLQSDDEIKEALGVMRGRLRGGGIVLLSLRDYRVVDGPAPVLPACRPVFGRNVSPICAPGLGLAGRSSLYRASIHNDATARWLAHPAFRWTI